MKDDGPPPVVKDIRWDLSDDGLTIQLTFVAQTGETMIARLTSKPLRIILMLAQPSAYPLCRFLGFLISSPLIRPWLGLVGLVKRPPVRP